MSTQPSNRSGPVAEDNSTAAHEGGDIDFYAPYQGFARTLRTWFIAYGVGGPFLFLSQAAIREQLLRSHVSTRIAYCFLGGVTAQVIIALLYKCAMWYLYIGISQDETTKRPGIWKRVLIGTRKCCYAAADWLSEAFWIELFVDLLTLGLFTFGTIEVIRVVTK